MIINENMKNELIENSAAMITSELPEFETWVTNLDEYRSLPANAEHVLSVEQLSCEKSKIEHRCANHMFNDVDISEEIKEYKTRYDDLVEAERFITTTSRTYSEISEYVKEIAKNVKHGSFDTAMFYYKKLIAVHAGTIVNPLKGINIIAIDNELHSIRRECSKIDAFMASRKKNIENFREFFIESSAMVGWGATALAVVYTAAKILKK